jgi:hypothetical protein
VGIVNLAEARRQLKITDPAATDDDDEIQAYCDGITEVIEAYKREVIEQRTITEDVERFRRGGRRFRLWSVPVISLTSVQSWDGAVTWDVANLRLTGSTGLVRVMAGPALSGLAEVVYEAGYAVVPEHFKRGALVTLQHNWETRRGVGSKRTGVIGPEEGYDPRFSYSIPRKALEWLGSPRPVVG